MLVEKYGTPKYFLKWRYTKILNFLFYRNLFDPVKGNFRALNTTGINSDHFGPLLITIGFEKLANVISL